ncbi:hypothetical protein C8F04DRAFT_1101067 [Mycena alexandri]|uniref:F-box domain-containing protein n=1 Tax=Mycena alexandri TaxID=1745969 RepID=A0AAD6SVU0_9AGAR|nr:hypothetical protein C8F04DRAFT_1101067 [Mycena alexandri]
MSSPFASRLGTNYCPQDNEVLEIQCLIQEPLARLKRLDDQIAELQKSIDELTKEHDTIGDYVQAHRALLTPIRRIPLDILQEIFVACLPTHRNCVMSAKEAPVLLGRICSSWRALSLSTPRLWASLHIAEPVRTSDSLDSLHLTLHARRVEVTKTWLARSGQCPLSLSLESDEQNAGYPNGSYGSTGDVFLQTLLPFTSRWWRLSLAAPPPVLDVLSGLTGADVPLLKTLEVRAPSPRPWRPFKLLGGSQISGFSLMGELDSDPLHLPLRWEFLTSLSLIENNWNTAFPLTSDAALTILSRCPRLRNCHFLLIGGFHPAPQILEGAGRSRSILELPTLHSLQLQSVNAPVFGPGGIFSSLSLPGLRHLVLSTRLQDEEVTLTFPFLVVSPQLQSFESDCQIYGKQSLLDLIRALPPTVQRLRLSGFPSYGFNDDTLAFLAPTPGCLDIIFPALQELSIMDCYDVSDAALLHFITARMTIQSPSVATLRRVDIQFNREQQLDIRPQIQSYLDVGLQVSTRYYPSLKWIFSPWRGLPDDPERG